MQKFFIDTANPQAISSIWSKIGSQTLARRLSGITTNPKALAKYFQKPFTLDDLKVLLTEINSLLNEFGATSTVIYVQVPSDEMVPDHLAAMVKFVTGLDFEVGIKVPHYTYFLEETKKYFNVDFNVTGVSDYLVASKVLSYEHLDYVSIIPGRMEEKGMNYIPGLSLLNQNKNSTFVGDSRVIAGSMRTLEQLIETLRYNCVPTVGETAFSNILPTLEQKGEIFESLFDQFIPIEYSFDESNLIGTELSKAFFEEMNAANLLNIK